MYWSPTSLWDPSQTFSTSLLLSLTFTHNLLVGSRHDLEVSKMFTEHEHLLGENRWSEMLKDPDEEEEKRVSRVFHSFYAKGRDAQNFERRFVNPYRLP